MPINSARGNAKMFGGDCPQRCDRHMNTPLSCAVTMMIRHLSIKCVKVNSFVLAVK